MKRKLFRIELREADSIFTDMVLMAALSNGGDYTSLNKIADSAEWLCKKYPASGSMHSVNRIGDNVLTIDKGTTNVLMITEVEILELDVPTLTRQDAKVILEGITNENNKELLN